MVPLQLRRLTITLGTVGLVALACHAPTAPPAKAFSAIDAFNVFWAQYDSLYCNFPYKNLDWRASRDSFQTIARQAPTADSLVRVLTRMLQPLRDGHAKFTTPTGTEVPSWQDPRPWNWQKSLWLSYMTRFRWRQYTLDLGYAQVENIGYVAIGAWRPESFGIADVDAVLSIFKDAPALILDVRPNGGGDEPLALAIAGRFTRERRLVDRVRWRIGPGYGDFSALRDVFVDPRGDWQFTQPVYVLMGRGSASSNEAFVSALKGLPNVMLLGDTTAGSSGNPKTFALGGGWTFSVPSGQAFRPDGVQIEWNGVAPDLFVPFDAQAVSAGTDPVLEEALQRARAARKPDVAALAGSSRNPAMGTRVGR